MCPKEAFVLAVKLLGVYCLVTGVEFLFLLPATLFPVLAEGATKGPLWAELFLLLFPAGLSFIGIYLLIDGSRIYNLAYPDAPAVDISRLAGPLPLVVKIMGLYLMVTAVTSSLTILGNFLQYLVTKTYGDLWGRYLLYRLISPAGSFFIGLYLLRGGKAILRLAQIDAIVGRNNKIPV